jgi:hypothetical protein
MSEIEVNLTLRWGPVTSLARKAAIPVFIFVATFLAYYLSGFLSDGLLGFLSDGKPVPWCGGDRVSPGCWYQHHIYLADAILNGSLDVATTEIPDWYQDVVVVGESKYLPFPPGPALLLVPFVAIWGTGFSQVYFSMALGAANVVLFWYLLGLLNISRTTKLLLVPFFALGTAHFYSATTGTVWFYNHVAAVFFLFLALIFLFKRASPIVPAVFLGFAYLCREPTILAAPFFLYWMVRQRHPSILSKEALLSGQTLREAALFGGTLVPFVAFFFWYNIARFDGPLDTGYDVIRNGYVGMGLQYSFYLNQFPEGPHFNLFDVRNIPLHLYTIFLMPPEFFPDWSVFRPSWYGMSVLLTSPAFIFAALVKRNDVLKLASWLAIALVSVPLLLHWTQGWVQFGYRFALDFMPFLLILTAFGFDDNASPTGRRIQVLLVAVAILAGFWGRYWANELGW